MVYPVIGADGEELGVFDTIKEARALQIQEPGSSVTTRSGG